MSTARSGRIRDADLYFKNTEKSQGEIQFYWVALAAFVVKDIVHAYEYTRDLVLSGAWRGSAGDTLGQDPYTHNMRTKGSNKSLATTDARMKFVDKIAKKFNDLMVSPKYGPHMLSSLKSIQGWPNA